METYDVMAVRDEFLKGIYEQYLQIYSEKQAEISIELLTEFCNNLKNNQLVLMRVVAEQPPKDPFVGQKVPAEPTQQPLEDPFAQEHIKKEVEELNNNMRAPERARPIQRQTSNDEVDMGSEHKRTFVDKVRDMRTMKKDPNRINPED